MKGPTGNKGPNGMPGKNGKSYLHVYFFLSKIDLYRFVMYCLKCLKMSKGQSEAVHQRRTDHTMAKTKRTTNDLQHIFDIS